MATKYGFVRPLGARPAALRVWSLVLLGVLLVGLFAAGLLAAWLSAHPPIPSGKAAPTERRENRWPPIPTCGDDEALCARCEGYRMVPKVASGPYGSCGRPVTCPDCKGFGKLKKQR